MPNTLPADAQVVALNPGDISDKILAADWPDYSKTDAAWGGKDQIRALGRQSFWVGANLADATTSGYTQTLIPEDVPFPGGTMFSQITIKAKIKNMNFQDADGVNITQSSSGGGTVGMSGSVTTTNTVGASGGLSGTNTNPEDGGTSASTKSVGVTASSGTASAVGGTASATGSVQTGAAATEGVRFTFDVDWTINILQRWDTGTMSAILTLGTYALAKHLALSPSQAITASSTGGVVRFPKVRCSPVTQGASRLQGQVFSAIMSQF